MYPSNHNFASSMYRNVSVDTGVASANSHGLISMLLAGAIERTQSARLALNSGNARVAGDKVSAVIAIVSELRSSLDHSAGGRLASNLDSLYDYIQRRLFQARRQASTEVLSEILDLLAEVHSAWLDIGQHQ